MKKSFFLFLALLVALTGGVAQATQPVGEVTLLVGEAKAHRANGSLVEIKKGGLIYAGDVLETSDGGHVHVRFVDGALISVRPSSRLVIENYEEHANKQVTIKFKLEKGVVRSITGQWGQSNPEKFRLNTPVAAIGVKGTDFVVKVENNATQAVVFTGSIAMSPLTNECVETLGLCNSDKSLTLTADMQGLMLQLMPQRSHAPTLEPAVDLMVGKVARNPIIAVEKTSENDAYSGNNARTAIIANKVIEPKAMAWLHNRFDWNVPSHTISERFTEALASGMQPVVGDLFVSLYRDETILKAYQPVLTSQVTFSLKESSAVYQPLLATGLPLEVAQVAAASLIVNFAKSTYVTHLDISAPSIGSSAINLSGQIDPSGRFVDANLNTNVAGALSTNGEEAGYMFKQTIGQGALTGLTLWGR